MENFMPEDAVPHYALEAINRFLGTLGTMNETKFTIPCIDGLREFVTNWDHFKNNTVVAKRFLGELQTHLRDCRNCGGLPDQSLGDAELPIVECLAVIFREESLKQPTRQQPPAQASLLRFFEEEGEWRIGDGNLITDFYYFILPMTVEAATA